MDQKDPRKRAAASALAAGRSQATAAKDAGVARSSVLRWQTTDEFKELIEEERKKLEELANPLTLESLVPLAHKQLKESLEGTSSISAAQANIALQILKNAGAAEGSAASVSSLESRLAALTESEESD